MLTACGSGDSVEGTSEQTAAVQENSTSAPADAGDEPVDAGEQDAETAAEEEAWVEIFPEIALSPTEPGPRPTLAWESVDGAALYQLTVLDSDGAPYWSWSGTEASVPLGGMDNPDAIGAWVFEELSWMVVARDTSGAPLGMSRRGQLLP
jgi:hypothetical protein